MLQLQISENNEDQDILLSMKEEPIRSGKFVQIEMDMLPTVSSSILSSVLADVPLISENVRDGLANDTMFQAWKFLDENFGSLVNKSLVIFIEIRIYTDVIFDREVQELMKELSRGACGEGQRSNQTDEEAECAICLEKEYSDESAMIRMQCSHIFHSDCITPWFEER